MKIALETCNDGSFVVSNTINQITILPRGEYYLVQGCGQIDKVDSREKAFDIAISMLTNNNVMDIDGFINHLETHGMDIDDNYRKTICNLINYAIRHECIVQNQLVDWLVSIISNVTVQDVVGFVNNYWLNDEYIRIKESLVFSIKAWVLADEIWPDQSGHVDMGYKKDLARGYRIEATDMCGTRWLPIDLVEGDNIMAYFNNTEHREFYTANGYQLTGRICFIGYFRKENDEYVPID